VIKMKSNKRSKGMDFQRWVKKFFEKRGWTVHNETMKPIWVKEKKTGQQKWVSQRNDIFGCIDLIAKRENRETIWIQATMDSHLERREKELEKVPWNVGEIVLVFLKRKSGGVDVFVYRGKEEGLELVGKIKRGEPKWKYEFFEWYLEKGEVENEPD